MTEQAKKRVCVVGSGNWGSAIAKIVGANVVKYNNKFETRVTMYVYEEIVNSQKLTDIINQLHENVKYLPGHKLPENIGFDRGDGTNIELISKIIEKHLRIQCYVLMGANLANEVAEEKFCETTIGCRDKRLAPLLRDLIQTPNFRVVVVEDCEAVEVCGALKNIVACAAGFVDGLGLGDNTKAAVIRLGLMEMVKFVDTFYSGSKLSTFFESCGVADLITTCYGGRNRRVCEQYVKSGKTIRQLEEELLGGQKLQGPATADEVHGMLKGRNLTDKFPLFTAVHRICTDQIRPADLLDQIRNHPEHVMKIEGVENA
ncbi:unnamed protein product [Xylocopa violacea]|uniref:Glycerol-3-phosphate dehydrogenase [NAD(+)], cytoplasmic n=1 Tax=Xylocopa violacea TaxID=135666 RepID=A0ABP1NKB6_XYLVO